MVHKTCCKAVSVTISFADNRGTQSHCVGFIFVIPTHFLKQSVVVCKSASVAKRAALSSTSTALLAEVVSVVVKRGDIEAQVSRVRKGSRAASSEAGMMDLICRRE